MTGRPLIGLFMALFVESAHWIRVRWDFNDEACTRAWQISVVAIVIAGTLIYLDGSARLAASILFTWLPPLLLPMQFVESFGLRNSVPANTFSLLAQQRRKRNARLGLTESVIHINFGNVTFVTALVGSTLGNQSSGPYAWLFLPGMIVLTGWMLLSSSRSRPTSLIIALTVAGFIALAGQRALEELDDRLSNSGPGARSGFDPGFVNTLIGRRGTIEQSPDIIWRLKPGEKQAPPSLLRTASYNAYNTVHVNARWLCQPISETGFIDLDTRLQADEPYFILAREALEAEQIRATSKDQRRFTLRGSVVAESPLPLPGSTSSLKGFELDGIERNTFGTVRVFPKHSVIEGSVLWGNGFSAENPVSLKEDLDVPFNEREPLRAILKELNLLDADGGPPPLTLQEKLAILQNWFRRNFHYSRDLTIDLPYAAPARPTAIEQFLTEVRAGHCEYFAGATVLLLRQAGIPARYAIGYAVTERDAARNEYVIRGTHGHAWCRVWDEQAKNWIDFDTTPGSWIGTLPPQTTRMQAFNDMLKRWREDFFLWRNRPANRLAVSLVMGAIALGVLLFITKRLWKSKRRMDEEKRSNGYTGPLIRTPLHGIEKHAQKQIGPRPPGTPFAEWLLRLRPGLTDGILLDEALALHQRLRFDPAPALPEERERLVELVKRLETAIKR